MRSIIIASLSFLSLNAFAGDYWRTVEKVDLERFMGQWYVIASRPTRFEKGAHNAIEIYTWNDEKNRIDIDFTFNKNSFDGKLKSMPQKAFIENWETGAHWKVNPFLWFKFDYLVIGLADDYSWTVIGVPDQKWVWVMARDYNMSEEQLADISAAMEATGYDMSGMNRIPHQY